MALRRMYVDGITIDGPDSLDLDDAIWLKRDSRGRVSLQVSISDVASEIELGSELDRKACEQVMTRYYRSGNSPMIPRRISEGSASLLPNKERLTVTITIPFKKDFSIGSIKVRPTRLSSKAKLSYEEADLAIKDKKHEFHELLSQCNVIAQALLEKRKKKGAFAIYDLIRGIATREDGTIVELTKQERYLAYVVIQEFMILINETVAQFLAERHIPAIYRNHTATEVLSNRERILKDIQNAVIHPDTFDIEILRRRINVVFNRASYGTEIVGHYGLNSAVYTHFTSPIRRYPDLVNQRILHSVLEELPLPYTKEDLDKIISHVNSVEGEIKDKRRSNFKALSISRNRIAADNPAELSIVSDDEFSAILKVASSEGRMTEALQGEVLKRLEKDSFDVQEIAFLCFPTTQDKDKWRVVHEAIGKWIINHPNKVVSLCNTAEKLIKGCVVERDIRAESSSAPTMFIGSCRITYQDSVYESGKHTCRSKRDVERSAVVYALFCVLGITEELLATPFIRADVVGSNVVEEDKARVVEEDGQVREDAGEILGEPVSNFKSELFEWASKSPERLVREFNIEQHGPDHQVVFLARAEVMIGDVVYQSKPKSSTTKKWAEQWAAADLLQTVRGIGSSMLKNKIFPFREPKGNAVSKIETYTKQRNIPPPEYIFKKEGARDHEFFICNAEIKHPEAGILTGCGEGNKKKAAKLHAAEQLFDKILDFHTKED